MKIRRWINQLVRLVSASFLIAMLVISCAVLDRADTASRSTQVVQYPQAWSCCTQDGQCPLSQPQPPESDCYCTSPYGPVPGYAC